MTGGEGSDPRRPPGVPRRRHITFGRRSVAREVERELRAHLRLKEDELIARGMSRDEAAREARRAFGDERVVAGECVAVRTGRAASHARRERWRSVVQDARIAVHGFRRAPGFTAVVVVTLALGIGANTAIFSVIDAVVGRGVPYRDPARLMAPSLEENVSISKQRLELIRARQRSLTSVAGYSRWGLTLTGSGEAEQLQGAVVTADLFDALGVPAAIGRTFVDGEDRPGRSDVVVLGHGLWTERFGADSGILGRVLRLNGRPHAVVGVMPPGFAFPVAGARLWVPTTIVADSTDDYVSGYLLMVGRLRPGASRDASLADLRRVVRELAAERLAGFQPGDESTVRIVPLGDVLVGDVGRVLFLLLAAVAFVLLIACVNVANLLLARASARGREFAVRASLGAGRGRLVRQALTESVLLAVAGGAAGVLLALGLIHAFAASVPANSPGAATIGLDLRVLLFALGLSLTVGIVFGLAPALQLARGAPGDVLREGGRGGTMGAHRYRLMRSLVVGEVALAVVLAIGAGLALESFRRLQGEHPGFRAEGVLSFSVTIDATRYPSPESQAQFFDDLFDRLGAVPGTREVGAIHLLPLAGGNWNPSLVIEGRPLPEGATPREVDWRLVTPGYFRTMEIPLLAGRVFEETDQMGTPPVAVINRALADRYFRGENPIGQRVRTFFEGRGNPATIVGVVGDTKDQALAGATRPQIYRSFWQRPQTWMSVLVRTAGSPSSIAPAVRETMRALDPNAPVTDVRRLIDVVASSIAQPRLMMWLLGLFGALAVGLGAIGIYGVMSYVVQQRTPEIGVRMALGARPLDIRRLVLGDALRLAGIGLGLGVLGALALTRFLATQLYEVSVRDPAVYAACLVLLAGIAAAASWLPARRAARSQPTDLLRVG
ncbi:MAG TPA: ABC transporter permease [Gemmatimonadaceae bacterium]|nr:ABC transporter permease [Gemmatimonadaceae bacterium]